MNEKAHYSAFVSGSSCKCWVLLFILVEMFSVMISLQVVKVSQWSHPPPHGDNLQPSKNELFVRESQYKSADSLTTTCTLYYSSVIEFALDKHRLPVSTGITGSFNSSHTSKSINATMFITGCTVCWSSVIGCVWDADPDSLIDSPQSCSSVLNYKFGIMNS